MIAVNLIFYIFVFFIGTIIGSFLTLAVHRIPLKQDITHERSYCPKCKHKLMFWDLIPVFSYIFLGGKCRYCKEKIRPRYLILEILSGIALVLLVIPFKNGILLLKLSDIAYVITAVLYIIGLIIIAGIDKEKNIIKNEVILFIVIVETLYIIYLYILENANVYRYVMYLFVVLVLIVINNLEFTKKLKNNYTIQTLILFVEMAIFCYEPYIILTTIFTLLVIAIENLIYKLKQKKYVKKNSKKEKKIPVCYYLCMCNIIVLVVTNLLFINR